MSFYAKLAKELNQGSTRAALGLLGFRSNALREHLRSLYQSPAGTGSSFLADPVFEATFGWQPGEQRLDELSGNLLHPTLVSALTNPAKLDGSFLTDPWSTNMHPYRHQLEAWRHLHEEIPRSVLVSSGTGSGKTECFLVPILNDLAIEADASNHSLTGVRALFLYPLNALIKSQKDRLSGWLGANAYHNRVRYCLYKGDTPETTPYQQPNDFRCEVRGRDVLRSDPPPILITNATMLEYMLVRDKDRPIIQRSQGTLRWIVIDEAHNYIGSQAAELALLLRRVLHAFGRRPEDVRFVATSATISEDTKDQSERRRDGDLELKEFLSNLSGVPLNHIYVVRGARSEPVLERVYDSQNRSLPVYEELQLQSDEEKYQALASNQQMRSLRRELMNGATRLTTITSKLFPNGQSSDQQKTLELLDLCTKASLPDGEERKPFLPLRGHFFHRAQAGLWACINPCCSGRTNTPLDSPEWGFGKIFLDRRKHCDAPDCMGQVFEVVQCGECGAEYLSAQLRKEGQTVRMVERRYEEYEDEYQSEPEEIDDDGIAQNLELEPIDYSDVLIVKDDPSHPTREKLLKDGNRLAPVGSPDDGILVSEIIPTPDLICACCNKRQLAGQELFRPIRLGGPFLLQSATPTLLKFMRPMEQPGLPWGGRRIISFTDSRQGTARFATKLQQETERNFVKSYLYHRLSVAPEENADVEELNNTVAALRQQVEGGNELLRPALELFEAQLLNALNPPLASMSWNSLCQNIEANCPQVLSFLRACSRFLENTGE